jgi:hypothetical protein
MEMASQSTELLALGGLLNGASTGLPFSILIPFPFPHLHLFRMFNILSMGVSKCVQYRSVAAVCCNPEACRLGKRAGFAWRLCGCVSAVWV